MDLNPPRPGPSPTREPLSYTVLASGTVMLVIREESAILKNGVIISSSPKEQSRWCEALQRAGPDVSALVLIWVLGQSCVCVH